VLELSVAAGILLDGAGKALIAQRAAGTHMAGAWEFPGGKLAAGETALEALVRELAEELAIQPLYVRHLSCLTHNYPDRIVHLHVWQVLDWAGQPRGVEGQPIRWVALGRLLEEGLLPADRKIVTALQADTPVNNIAWRKFATAIRS
jgi:8-oxo-dGTP diphosphatase